MGAGYGVPLPEGVSDRVSISRKCARDATAIVYAGAYSDEEKLESTQARHLGPNTAVWRASSMGSLTRAVTAHLKPNLHIQVAEKIKVWWQATVRSRNQSS